MKKHPWLWASLLIMAAVACLWGRRWVGAATLTADEQALNAGRHQLLRRPHQHLYRLERPEHMYLQCIHEHMLAM